MMQSKTQPQIKFTAYVGASIDGVIAESGKSSNKWASRKDQIFFQKALKGHDVFVVGHNTYRVAKERLNKKNTIVFTSKVSVIKKAGSVNFLNPERTNILNFLKKNKYKRVAILGGAKVYDYFLEHKMFHEFFVTIEPLVFSAGVRMFEGKKFKIHKFILESVKKLNKRGTLLLKYKNAN